MTGTHTSLPRLAVWFSLSYNIRSQSYNIERPHSIDVQYTLKVFQRVRAFLGQSALGNAHSSTVDDSIEPPKPLLGQLDNMLNI